MSAALGLSHGALYTYVDSKQALLYLALLHTIRPDTVNGLALPVAAPPPHEIVALVDASSVERLSFPVLHQADDQTSCRTSAIY